MKILVIRSAPLRVLEEALALLKSNYPDSIIHVLAQQDVAGYVRERHRIDNIHIIPPGPINPKSLSQTQLESLINESFDLIVVLYNNRAGLGYGKVEKLAYRLRANKYLLFYGHESFNYVSQRCLRRQKIWASFIRLWIRLRLDITRPFKRIKVRFDLILMMLLARLTPGRVHSRRASKGKIRVLHVTDCFYPGGVERSLFYTVTNLDRNRYDIHVAVLNNKGYFRKELERHGIPIHDIGLYRGPLPMVSPLYRLYRCCRRLQPDIVYGWNILSGILASIAGKWAHIPRIIFSPRNQLNRFFDNKLDSFYKKVYRYLIKHSIRLSHVITATCQAIIDDFQNFYKPPGKKWVVVPNGIRINDQSNANEDISIINNEIDADNLTVITTGNLKPGKDYSTFFKAVALVHHRFPCVQFAIAGTPQTNDMEAFRFMAYSEGVLSCCHFLGFVEDVKPYIQRADVCVLSSLYEGLANSIIEYMLLGKPTVATAVGGVQELIKNGYTGFLVPPRSPDVMARKIITLLENKDLREKMGRNARKWILENCSMERMIDATERAYSL